MKRIFKKTAAFIAAAVMTLSLASCGGDPIVGNLGDVKKEDNANEIYAVISVRDYGDITAKLFPGAAPKAVERFTENAERGYYDGTTIHRVIDQYIMQGGSLNGDGSDGNVPDSLYIPVETSEVTFNFYGALCLAASKKGCYSQFYIVNNNQPQNIDAVIEKLTEQLGDESFTSRLLDEDKKKYQDYLTNLKAIPEEVKEKYKRVGGCYELDGTSTVFGQVIDGFSVVRAIAATEVVSGNKADDKLGKASKPIDTIIIDHIEIIRIEPEVSNTEETTTKKAGKTKKTSDEVNAETLPTLASEDDTTAPTDDTTASEGDTLASSEDTAGESEIANSVTEESSDTSASEDTTIVPDAQDYTPVDSSSSDDEEVVVIDG
ncbi:MAG: peptidylprolyl isomerase [Ruminiclostridium sp.]|nr:peptidylprolyl isomerase [Ruminiclostridium sp.]